MRPFRALRPRRATLRLTGPVLASALLLAACGWFDSPGPRVVVIGDSITRLVADDLERRVGDTYQLEISATNGATADEMVAAARKQAQQPVDELIVNLGTNDVIQRRPPADTLGTVAHLLALFPDARCRFVVTINQGILSFSDPGLSGRITALNRALKALAEDQGDVSVIDWSGAAAAYTRAGNPEGPLTVETVHPTGVGQRILADLYEKALAGCKG